MARNKRETNHFQRALQDCYLRAKLPPGDPFLLNFTICARLALAALSTLSRVRLLRYRPALHASGCYLACWVMEDHQLCVISIYPGINTMGSVSLDTPYCFILQITRVVLSACTPCRGKPGRVAFEIGHTLAFGL